MNGVVLMGQSMIAGAWSAKTLMPKYVHAIKSVATWYAGVGRWSISAMRGMTREIEREVPKMQCTAGYWKAFELDTNEVARGMFPMPKTEMFTVEVTDAFTTEESWFKSICCMTVSED